MGSPETATRRLNLAQAFNPLGSLLGMIVASKFILSSLVSDERNEIGELIFTHVELDRSVILNLNFSLSENIGIFKIKF